jgi:hypothetical protein
LREYLSSLSRSKKEYDGILGLFDIIMYEGIGDFTSDSASNQGQGPALKHDRPGLYSKWETYYIDLNKNKNIDPDTNEGQSILSRAWSARVSRLRNHLLNKMSEFVRDFSTDEDKKSLLEFMYSESDMSDSSKKFEKKKDIEVDNTLIEKLDLNINSSIEYNDVSEISNVKPTLSFQCRTCNWRGKVNFEFALKDYCPICNKNDSKKVFDYSPRPLVFVED